MSYYLGKMSPIAFDEAVTRMMNALKKEGFGILTEIDVMEMLKKKLGVSPTLADEKRLASDGQIVPRRTLERRTTVESTNQLANANAMPQNANRVAIRSFGLKEQKERYDETDHQ